MAGDDILWKNVEALKARSLPVSEDAPTRTETGQKRGPRSRKASPAVTGSDGDDSSPSSPSQGTNGTRPISPDAQRISPPSAVQATDRTAGRAYGRLMQMPARPDLRRPERYAFQFWSDQITRLKKLRQVLNMAKDPEDRTEVTLSDLAREALDDYLDRQTQPTARSARPAG